MMQAARKFVLAINAGSSSMKLALYEFAGRTARCVAKWNGAQDDMALDTLFARLEANGERAPAAVGHRIVHGGPHHAAPAFIDEKLLTELEDAVPFAPLHLPAALAAIEAIRKRLPGVPQIACFDTAFHTSMPEKARRFPLPRHFDEQGVRRYGFHGLSYEYIVSELGAAIPSRVVIAHLGSGASLVAVRDGRSVDTTMGLTPTGGILMGTRTGDLDPGVLLHLARQNELTIDDLQGIVDHESGLLAIGGTSDMKVLIERAPGDPRARFAIDMFGYAIRKAIGALAFALGGMDLLVFTGGIGENAPIVREIACRDLDAFGIILDKTKNEHGRGTISHDGSHCAIRVIPTDEDCIIARHAHAWVEDALHSAPT
ncbi:acetate/propionate family kinase [Pendulispora brunnea]|uniref:Acetate kinase n=1 Tax=Pendulispora brunnea TaxID=2905690 RepID=A0ABZ2K4C6_9BACT